MTRYVVAVVLGVLALVAGCGSGPSLRERTEARLAAESSAAPVSTSSAAPVASGLDDAGRWACDDFAKGVRSATTRAARVELAGTVAKWAPRSTSGRIAASSDMLGRGADGSAGAWQIAADAFAQACFDAGWSGK